MCRQGRFWRPSCPREVFLASNAAHRMIYQRQNLGRTTRLRVTATYKACILQRVFHHVPLSACRHLASDSWCH
jgi:hypothetical protein